GQRHPRRQAVRAEAERAIPELPPQALEGRDPARLLPRRRARQLRPGNVDRGDRALQGRVLHGRAAVGQVSVEVPGRSGKGQDRIVDLGPALTWVAFFAALVAGLSFLAATLGREGAWRWGTRAFKLQWAGLLAADVFLLYITITHQYQYQYV